MNHTLSRYCRLPALVSFLSTGSTVSGGVTAVTLALAFGLLALGYEYFWVVFIVGFAGVLPMSLGAAVSTQGSRSRDAHSRIKPADPDGKGPQQPGHNRATRTATRSLQYERIRKETKIGAGGTADVYYATVGADRDERGFALKEPRVEGTLRMETIERLLEEAETWQQLDNHDHIVSVFDYDSEPLPWIGVEYMNAGHIGDRAGEMPLDQTLWTAIATAKAVRHAHRRGVAHLDLKPENILFRSVEDGWDVPKVADWGLSKQLLYHSKSIEGLSPQYAAPEQFDDEYGAVDDITDVYQLGAVFYELFTGRPPFEGKPFKVIKKIEREEPTPPSEVVDVPAELDEILLTALATEKEDRYEDVLLLRNDLQTLSEEVTEGF